MLDLWQPLTTLLSLSSKYLSLVNPTNQNFLCLQSVIVIVVVIIIINIIIIIILLLSQSF